MADVILTQTQADDLYHTLQAITEWCSDENFESALGSLTDNFGIADPLGRITELVGILQAETQTQQEEGDLSMQIIMNQVEIETAITDFVSRQINISTDQEITIELQATRGANGYTATLGIMPRAEAQASEERDERRTALVKEATAISLAQKTAEATKAAEPKPVAKATLGIAIGAKKPSGLLLKAQAEAEESDPEPIQAYTGEDDGADDEVQNSMAPSSHDDEPPMNETVKTADAPPPRSIFSKAKAG